MKYQKYVRCLLGLTILLAMVGCQKQEDCIEYVEPTCACTKHYDPVCGCNGKTYGNACMADCVGIRVEKLGPCD